MAGDDRWAKIRRLQQEAKDNSSTIITQQYQMAHMNRAYYDALIQQGFDEEQAMRLVEMQVSSIYASSRMPEDE